MHFPLHHLDLLEGGHGFVPHAERGGAGEFLRQVPDAMPRGDDHCSRRRFYVAMDDFQQRGLPCAVMAYQPDAVVVARRERNVLEQEIAREIYRQFVYLYQSY